MCDVSVTDATKQTLGLAPTARMPIVCGQCSKSIGPDDKQHALTCPADNHKGKTARHDAIVRELKQLVEEAGGSAVLEPRELDRRSRKRPDLDVWLLNNHAWLDVSVTHAFAPSRRGRGDVIANAAAVKSSKYEKMVEDSDEAVQFVPFAMGSYGEMSAEANRWLQQLAETAQATGKGEAGAWRRAAQRRLTIVLQRQNGTITRQWLTKHHLKAEQVQRVMEAQRLLAHDAPARSQ
jgi:hypothetical protein